MAQPTGSERDEAREALRERRATLWQLILGPLIWALHFLLSYVTAAVWCAKLVEGTGSLDGARVAVAVYTVLALAGIGIVLWRGIRKASFGMATVPHDFATAADRHRFLGFATVLLASLSLVATLYVTLAAVFIGSCA